MNAYQALAAITVSVLLSVPTVHVSAQTTAYVSSSGAEITTINIEDLSSGSLLPGFSQKGLAISSDGRFLYAAVGGFLQVIDVPADTSVLLIQVGARVESVVLSPDGKLAYTANSESQDVSVIDTELLSLVTKIPISGRGPKDIVVTPDGAFVYVSTGNSVFVTATETAGNTVVADINVGAGPDGERLFVATNLDSAITAFHIGPDTVLTRINAGAANHRGIDVTPDGSHLYVTNLNAESVSVIAIGSTTTSTSKIADSLVAMVSTTAEQSETPASSFTLISNAPNPFSETTTITYELDEPAEVMIEVLDVHGRVVRSGVTFEEAETAFYDEDAVEFSDPDHSDDDDRFLLMGRNFHLRILIACHCFRQFANPRID